MISGKHVETHEAGRRPFVHPRMTTAPKPLPTPRQPTPIPPPDNDLEAIRDRLSFDRLRTGLTALKDVDSLTVWLAAHMRDDLNALFGLIDGMTMFIEEGGNDAIQ